MNARDARFTCTGTAEPGPWPGRPAVGTEPVRLLNHDGSFNVRRNELGPLHPYNAYHTLLSLPSARLLALVAAGYFGTNLLFAALYWLAGPGALAGAAQLAARALRGLLLLLRPDARHHRIRQAGAGSRVANALVAIEALVGLLGFAILSGLLFARFTRPTAKIQFSDNALIAPYGDGWALMFRLVNLRNHDLTDVHAVVSFARWIEENGVRHRRFDQLDLERSFIIFMPLHWVIVHPITETQPASAGSPRKRWSPQIPRWSA